MTSRFESWPAPLSHCRTCGNELADLDRFIVSNLYRQAFCCEQCLWEADAKVNQAVKQEQLFRHEPQLTDAELDRMLDR